MALASTSVHVIEWGPPNGSHQCLCPQGELQLLSDSLGDCPRLAGRSDPGSFQITASALGHRACETLCVPFKSWVSISYSPVGLPKVNPTGFQSQMLWGFTCLVQDSWAGQKSQCGPQTSHSFGRTSAVVIIHLFVDHLPGDNMGLDCIPTPPLLPISL